MATKITHEEFLKRVYDSVLDEYSVLGRYEGGHVKIELIHNICGYRWLVEPNSFLNAGQRCPDCQKIKRGKSKSIDIENFMEKLNSIFPNEFIVIGEYKNLTTKVEIFHNPCGKSRFVLPDSLLRGSRCPTCASKLPGYNFLKTQEQYKEDVFLVYENEYSVLGEYVNAKTPIRVVHNDCGFIWDVNPDNLIRGHGCPKCSSLSVAEDNTEFILLEFGFVEGRDFICQARFSDCKNKNSLPFDFYLPNYNLCIEIHGKQHYEPIEYFGGKETFKEQKKRDKIKVEYCKNNNISLLVVPYWDFKNIEEILRQTLFG